MPRSPRVFTIPAGTPFLPTLADALLSGELTGGWPAGATLADATIYLPTRRAGRALGQILAERTGRRALLLPRIVPLGDAEEVDLEAGPSATAGTLPPAIPPLERRLILTRLVQGWSAQVDRLNPASGLPFALPGSPADAVALASDLEGLMDALAMEDVDWGALEGAVEIEYSRYFRLTLDFVRIAHENWPAILAERGASDPARRRNAALDGEAARLRESPPGGPVVAAGSTGSIPATARLLAAIARAPHGAVVLPGLDQDLDEAGWRAIGAPARAGTRRGVDDAFAAGLWGHPQFGLRRLLEEHLGLGRHEVPALGTADGRTASRRALLSEVMRPAETTDAWAAIPPIEHTILADKGSEGLVLVEAPDERQEALAIAVALRETLAEPGRRAAFVTPDRALAARVAAELGRWGVAVEDSAGRALAESAAGRLARLAAEAAASDFQPGALLALLAHPELTLGWPRDTVERAAGALEVAACRGPAPRPGLAGLAAALDLRRRERSRRDPEPRRRLAEGDWELARELLDRLDAAFGDFRPKPDDRLVDLVALAGRHEAAVAALTSRPEEAGTEPDAAREALDRLFDDLAAASVADGAGRSILGRFADYPAFFASLARGRTLAPEARSAHRRVKILGLLEARLLDVDRVVLGGLDETIWPPVATTDAFLNRPMRLTLGLSPPERRIGQTAHDFVQALATGDAIVTRSRKRGGKPTVPSRFLERLRAFLGEPRYGALRSRGERYLTLAAELDRAAPSPPVRRPAPTPGAARFPRRLSVTEIETLVRDPYAIYARHVLRLDPLDQVAVPPSAADRGTAIHAILATFATRHPAGLPPDAEAALLQIGLDVFGPLGEAYPELHALWWPAFERFVPVYLDWERERRARLSGLAVEVPGRLEIEIAPDDSFALVARADRVETGLDGTGAVIDFKTGTPPSNRAIAAGFSPQMTLEAAILRAGGFRDVPASRACPDLLHVKIGGRATMTLCPVAPPPRDKRSLDEIAAEHLAGLTELVRRYGRDGAGYLSRPYPQFAARFAAYDHLARVKEWSLDGESEGAAA
ncbi:MAG: double-strand break repair protein AddB [Methylobacteriaceae bacterium]|nr:double-strand break repair protein AddB [Methylobacteriaceae bacterium]